MKTLPEFFQADIILLAPPFGDLHVANDRVEAVRRAGAERGRKIKRIGPGAWVAARQTPGLRECATAELLSGGSVQREALDSARNLK